MWVIHINSGHTLEAWQSNMIAHSLLLWKCNFPQVIDAVGAQLWTQMVRKILQLIFSLRSPNQYTQKSYQYITNNSHGHLLFYHEVQVLNTAPSSERQSLDYTNDQQLFDIIEYDTFSIVGRSAPL